MMMDPQAFNARPKSAAALRRARERKGRKVLIFQLLNMAVKQYPCTPGYFDLPIIEVRRRKSSEVMKSGRAEATRWKRENADETIGRAVLLAYRDAGNLQSAFLSVASRPEVEGIHTGGYHSVRGCYLAFRRLAMERGYADSRAFAAEINGEPWPADQVWLSDFPEKGLG
jgi:hypothetical protein